MPETSVKRLDAAAAEGRIGELAAVLVDAVEGGASVNFMKGLATEGAAEFWRGQLPGLAGGSRILLVAETSGRIVGTVVVTLAHQPNGPHRGEVGKMIVARVARRQGLGARLLRAAEEAARTAGRTLLVLDTETGSAGERLYLRHSWTKIGEIPNYALTPDGRPTPASFFFKELRA